MSTAICLILGIKEEQATSRDVCLQGLMSTASFTDILSGNLKKNQLIGLTIKTANIIYLTITVFQQCNTLGALNDDFSC